MREGLCPWRGAAGLLVGAAMLAGSAALSPLYAQNSPLGGEEPLPAWLTNQAWVAPKTGPQLFHEDDLIRWERLRVSLPDSPDNPLERAFPHPKARPPLHTNDVGMVQMRFYITY
jgi:hypothetical protein